jgi:hypothetical protein
MEGNFYISERLVRRKAKSRLEDVFSACHPVAAAYGRCVEVQQVNRGMAHNVCQAEREVLDQCIDKELSSAKMTRTKNLV